MGQLTRGYTRHLKILILALLITGCKQPHPYQKVNLRNNIWFIEQDEKTGWTRVLLDEPELWGYIDKDSNVVIPFAFTFLNPFDEQNMALAEINGKHGFINTECDTVIPFIYNDLGIFTANLTKAQLGDKHGYLNRKGETVIPFVYDDAHGFLNCGVAKVSQNNKWGFIGTSGKVIIPLVYEDVQCHFEDSLLFALKDEKWAIFDKDGNQKSDFIYDKIYGLPVDEFYNEKYLFNWLLLVKRGKHYCYLNRNLEVVIDFGTYTAAEPITESGYAIVQKGNQYGIINAEGELVLPCIYPLIEHPAREYQGYYDEFYIHKNGKVGLFSKHARPLTGISYDSFQVISCYRNEEEHVMFVAEKNNRYGLIGDDGKMILPEEYDEIRDFESDQYAIAIKNGLYGLLDCKGEVKLPFEYKDIISHRKDNYVVEKKGRFGVISKNSLDWLIPPNYEDLTVCYYDEGRYIAKKNGKYGIIDRNLKVIIPFVYDKISNWVEYGPAEHFVSKDGKEGITARDGRIVIPTVYDELYFDNYGIIKVKKNNLWGTISSKNKIIHPIEYQEILWEWPYLKGTAFPDTIFLKKSGKYFATDMDGNIIRKSVSVEYVKKKFKGYVLD